LETADTSQIKLLLKGSCCPNCIVELAFAQPGMLSRKCWPNQASPSAGQVIARLQNIEALQAEVARAEEACLLAEQAFGRAEAEALSAVAAANEAVRVSAVLSSTISTSPPICEA
jgi:hypothetical protein